MENGPGRPGTMSGWHGPKGIGPTRADGPHGPCLCRLRAWPQAQARPCGPFFVPCRPVKPGPIHGSCQPMAHNTQITSNTSNFFTFTVTQQIHRIQSHKSQQIHSYSAHRIHSQCNTSHKSQNTKPQSHAAQHKSRDSKNISK